jgi:hypothetical protein
MPKRKLPNLNNPLALLKSVVCPKANCRSIKLEGEPCEQCIELAKLRKEHPEITPEHNWHLRSPRSQKSSQRSKRKKILFAKLNGLRFRILSLVTLKELIRSLEIGSDGKGVVKTSKQKYIAEVLNHIVPEIIEDLSYQIERLMRQDYRRCVEQFAAFEREMHDAFAARSAEHEEEASSEKQVIKHLSAIQKRAERLMNEEAQHE